MSHILRIMRQFDLPENHTVDTMLPDHTYDVIWQHRQSDDLPDAGAHPIMIGNHPDNPSPSGWIPHRFSADGKVQCQFLVSDDGRQVRSVARPWVSGRDVERLFSDVVMRTILMQMDLPSFHASALEKNGQALMIMAAKGCGKSTLSGALRQLGWDILADDLVRVVALDTVWHALPGPLETKLNQDSAKAIGQDSLGAQWVDASGDTPNKYIYPTDTQKERTSAPVTHIIFLDPRSSGTILPQHMTSSHGQNIMRLLQNTTANPAINTGITPHKPSQNMLNTVAGLGKQARIMCLSLPDDLMRLGESARHVDEGIWPSSHV